jgi:CheY-like chemotaxis protein
MEVDQNSRHKEPPLRILLVEDNVDSQLLIRACVKDGPYELEIAENGAIGVEKFVRGDFDFVLMDMQMPVMDGYAATRAIRQWEKAQGKAPTPIIAVTANGLQEEREKSLAAGCTAHMVKPIRREELLETVRMIRQPVV